ncbi:MAG: GatB/YqeY domain-containing protein [Synergistaceae bacterium]|nr:GatB/YqeY domain-containing protein [Synergistaceae bacterium]MBQ4418367.1 GatB/YqeY domain-containing protein [Synergistaceae bacterium]MBQ7569388.1 GatB/YqeY domain-containing protein [Synergistaceae bacterium]
MSLVEQVAADLMAAMKARNDAKLSALRMLKAEFQKLQADKGVGVKIADEDAQAVIRRLIKQRKEAAEQFKAGGALDRAEAELSDIKFLEPYLPAQLDDAELDKLIEAAAAEVGASSVKDMGKLMKAVMSKTAGRADGGRVKNRVTAFLNK